MQDFSAFTIKSPTRANVLISPIGVSQAFDPKVIVVNQPKIIEHRAIWDTGASCSVISKEYAAQVGLIPTGKTTITGVNNSTLENTYQVNIYLPNKVCIGFIRVIEVPALAGGAGMLIGMDIIGSGDFSTYNEDGKTVMTYRFPSVGGEDFSKLAGEIRAQKEIAQKLEQQKNSRKTLSKKEKLKRKQKRKSKQKTKRNKK